MTANGYRVSFGGDENVLKLTTMMLHNSVNILKAVDLSILSG